MKKLFLPIFLLLVIGSNAQISEEGLLGYFPFDGDVLDYSLNNYDGVNQGGQFGEDRFGNPESALLLNGTDQYIDLSVMADAFRDNLNEMTIYFWVKFVEENDWQTIISLGNEGEDLSTNVFEIEYENFDFQIETETGSNAVNHEQAMENDPMFFEDEWCEIMITLENNVLSYCKNGELFYQGEYIPAETNCNTLFVGCFAGNHPSTCCYFGGYIDELQFYDRIVKKREIVSVEEPQEQTQQETPAVSNFKAVCYPNPSSDYITIEFDQHYDFVVLNLYDASGKVVENRTLNHISTYQLPMPSSDGQYILELIDWSGAKGRFRIIKN